jgi:hypothetical protein
LAVFVMSAELRAGEATKDLISTYQVALDCVPILSEKLEFMQTETAIKAEALKEQMKSLIDGFEHLDLVSSSVSHGLQRAAQEYKEKVLDVAINGGVNTIGLDTGNLDRLRAELDSMAHERVVMDVLTRDMLREHKLRDVGKSTKSPTINQSGRLAGSKYKAALNDMRDFITIPEYSSSSTVKANKVVEKNMHSLVRPKGSYDDLAVRNSSLGVVVPSARRGLPEEVQAMKITPTSLPPRPKQSKR